MKEISEIVGIGALRYNIIKVQPEKDMVFKWEEAINFEGNAAPFIQYSHARTCSILSKKQDEIKNVEAILLNHESEEKLVKQLAKFPIVIEDACEGCKPHIIPTYVFEVASLFNKFYRDCPVLPEKNNVELIHWGESEFLIYLKDYPTIHKFFFSEDRLAYRMLRVV